MAITKIETVTVGSGGIAAIEFTSIPQTYTDLMVVTSLRSNLNNNTRDDMALTLNGSTSSIYSTRRLIGFDGSTVLSSANSSVGPTSAFGYKSNGDTSTASTFSNSSFYIPNYAGSTNKSISFDGVTETNSVNNELTITAGLFASSSAITSFKLAPIYGSLFMQYSTATLYGILKGSSGGVTVS